MGEVFLADDAKFGRQVALKRPSTRAGDSPEADERVRQEARAVGALSHPNIAAIFDVFDVDGRPHIVMEYVEGETLSQVTARGPIEPARAIDISLQLADALVEAHAHGVVHRDLKPGNIILTAADRVKVLDFGLAKVSHAPGAPSRGGAPSGVLLGSPGYMSPEQIVGTRVDHRTDIYAAGIVMFQLVTGRPPFNESDALGRALSALGHAEPPRADAINPAVPVVLADVIGRAMAREPEKRFQRAEELREALTRAKAGG
jgi:serine/threonine-protein kinase